MKYLILFSLLLFPACATVDMQRMEIQCQQLCKQNNDTYVDVKEVPQINYKSDITGEYYSCECVNHQFWM